MFIFFKKLFIKKAIGFNSEKNQRQDIRLIDSNQEELIYGTTGEMRMSFADTGNLDAFGRLRASMPETLFDSKNIFDDPDILNTLENQPLFYDNQETAGGGTSTAYLPNEASQSLTVTEGVAGTRVRQTKMRFNYQPGKSQLAIMTFNLYGGALSICRRSYATGSAVDIEVAQASWNIDKLDGTGASGYTIDQTKTQILFIDYEWLGVGRIRVGFVIDGKVCYAHEFNNANNLAVAYMSTPNLPLRSEISSDGAGVYTKREGVFDAQNGIFLKAVGGTATLTQICSTVISEGGSHDLGVIRSVSTAGTHLDANVENTNYVVLAVKLKDNYKGATVKMLNIALQLQTASHKVEWSLVLNPTIGGSLSYTGVAQSAIQFAKGATANTATGGYEITGGFLESGGVPSGASGSVERGIDTALNLGTTIAGTSDVLALCVRPIGGSTDVDVEGVLNWRELT